MAKQYLLFAKKEIDTNKQSVSVNQVVQMWGYNDPRYVVCKVERLQWGIQYHLIDLDTHTFNTTTSIRPLSEKFGIGIYYDDKDPQFKSAQEVAELLTKAQIKKKLEEQQAEEERKERERISAIGREWLQESIPQDAQAIIVARLKQDDSDSYTDYFASSVQQTIILGFSKHKRDLFSEMRKYANNFEGTAYLAEYNEEYEHREKYSMGDGYYLGKSKYSGWIIEKVKIYDRKSTIENFAYIAGNHENIFLKLDACKVKEDSATQVQPITANGQYAIVDYSQKAIALFGDTKPIKELLMAMGGKFNPRLTHNGAKRAGWIFQQSKREELETIINLKAE